MTTTKTKTDHTTLEMRRVLRAPVERVYRAWTEPAQISKWFGCGPTDNVLVTQDLRVGGQYKMVCSSCADGELATMYGVYKEIIPNRKLVYTWTNTSPEYPANDTLVTVDFIANGDTTEVIITHTNFAIPLSVEGHTYGWGSALDKFAAVVEE